MCAAYLEVVFLCHGSGDGLEGGREVVLEEPELHRERRALRHLARTDGNAQTVGQDREREEME